VAKWAVSNDSEGKVISLAAGMKLVEKYGSE
jgi:hypothetical protein